MGIMIIFPYSAMISKGGVKIVLLGRDLVVVGQLFSNNGAIIGNRNKAAVAERSPAGSRIIGGIHGLVWSRWTKDLVNGL